MQYQDIILEAYEWARARTAEKRWVGRFKVRVLSSPAGEMKSEEAVPIEYDYGDLQGKLQKLDKRDLDRAGLIDLGRALALLLLPPGAEGSPSNIRGLFADSLRQVGQDGGLRLKLRLPPELAGVPWEFMYVERAGGGDGMDGFLALDPRVAIVRHEALPVPAPLPAASGAIRVVAALASAIDLPPLDLAREEANLKQALAGQPGIQLDVVQDATLAEVQARVPGAAVFHFAGHGVFATEMGAVPGTVSGTGILALDDQYADAEQVGINLRGNGVRLAVLGGCETGRRDATSLNSVWSSVAAALVKAEVPAVVANQYSILDACAIAFSQQFYRALVGGLPIERAVTAGRVAAYNADKEGRDWGVPVLYLRAADGQLFAGAADPITRQEARQGAEVDVNIRAKEVAAGGEVLGARVREMLAGKLGVNIVIDGIVYGKVVGAEFGRLGGGNANVDMNIGTVGQGGSVTGAVIDSLG